MNTPVEMTVLNPFTGESTEPTDTVLCGCGWYGPVMDLEPADQLRGLLCPACRRAGWGYF